MAQPLLCPVHRTPLIRSAESLSGACGERFPVVDSVPVLLGSPEERASAARGSAFADPRQRFYDQTDHQQGFCRPRLDDVERDMQKWLPRATCDGPTLEIGSGKGALQGFGGDYVALDYSRSALAAYVDAAHERVCASAEQLPFPDATFRFVFSVAALEHVPKPDLAFAEIERVLKPGGVAYLRPAWHCVQYNCEGIPVRPYGDLDTRQKLVKMTLPLRRNLIVKALGALPRRVARRVSYSLRPAPTSLRYTPLRPDYETFWMSDSDAAASLDSHEGALFFHSRGYEVLAPGQRALTQLLARHAALVVRKPVGSHAR